jgi:anaerobic magnesium-protoporphyrin IX monomethyl ester cyclase
MNIIFIYSLNVIESTSKPMYTLQQKQYGISYISSFLKEHGHQTKLIVLSRVSDRKNRTIIDEYLKRFYPKLICFTGVSTEYQFIANIAKYIKSHYPDIYLLVGGPHVSLNPEEVLLDDFDALCIGEGENPTLELLSQLEKGAHPSGIPNLWIKHGSEIEKNSPRPFLQDLDSLPFPDREMWQEWIEERQGSKDSVLLARGCPFQCTYCCNHALKKLAPGAYVRFRSPDNIVKEIKEIANRSPSTKEIYLEVESFGINKEWARELCSKLERFNKTLDQPLSFGANLRITPNADLENLFVECKKCNFRFINIGLESGSERVRREILKRNYSNEDIISAVALARKYGLKIALFNMIGIPGETIADFKETVKINRVCLPDWHYTSIFFPYPGTDLYFLCKQQGLLKKPLDTEMERQKATLDLPGFTKKQIQKSYIWFDYYVYKGHKPIYIVLGRVLQSKFASKSYLNIFLRRLSRLAFFNRLRIGLK